MSGITQGRFCKRLVLAAALLNVTYAYAEEQKIDSIYNLSLEELSQLTIKVATGSSVPIEKAPAIASVITAEEMETLGARTLYEALEFVPGIHISPSTISRLDPIVSIRGIHTGFNNQVLMLLNGVPLSNVIQNRPTNFQMPITFISRIEIIRGPGSAIFGADAYAGVINIITKEPEEIESFEIGTQIGSFDTNDLWLETKYDGEDWNIGFGFSYLNSSGDDSRIIPQDQQTSFDSFFNTNASLAPGALNTGYEVFDIHMVFTTKRLNLRLWNWLAETELGAGISQALDPVGKDTSNLFILDAEYTVNELKDWEITLEGSYFNYNFDAELNILPPGTQIPIGLDGNVGTQPELGSITFTEGLIGNPSTLTEKSEIGITSIYEGFKNHRLRYALGFVEQKADSSESKNFGPGVITEFQPVIDGTLTNVSDTENVFLPDTSRSLIYVSVQDEWNLAPQWNFVGGIRYDDYSDFGETINPRLALIWETTNNLTTKLLYGRAFRVPTFTELGFINNPVSLGNQDLSPEKIKTTELSVSYQPFSSFLTRINLFDYSARDLIVFVPNETGASEAQNAFDQDGFGFEWEFNWQIAKEIRLSGNYAFQESEDSNTGDTIADAPGQQFSLIANWSIDNNWNINSQFNYVADRTRLQQDPRDPIDNYHIINLVLHRKNILDGLDASLAINNLSDQDAREPSDGIIVNDIPLEERSFWLRLNYQLK